MFFHSLKSQKKMFTYKGAAFIKNQYTFNTHVIRIIFVMSL